LSIVSIISERCKACYACIRNCPVKAIKVEDGKSRVVEERCISCGSCVRVCSQNAKAISSQVDKVTEYLRNNKTIAVIAPSFPASFPGVRAENLFETLEELGFFTVHEATIGVEATLPHYREVLAKTSEPVISSFCPAVVNLIQKYYPHLVKNLAPIDTAVLAAGKVLKKHYRDAKFVFIGPCIAKKHEVEGNEAIDAVLTFKELKQMLQASDLSFGPQELPQEEETYLPQHFPISGGLLRNLGLANEGLVVDGAYDCMETLKVLPNQKDKPRFLDILFCKGCVDGPEIDSTLDLYSRIQAVVQHSRNRVPEKLEIPPDLDLSRHFTPQPIEMDNPSEKEIRDILKYTFKLSEEDELNCGACGYNTCREKAVAVYQGLAEIDMCLPYLIHKSRGEIEYYKERIQTLTGKRRSIESVIGETQGMLETKKLAEKAAANDLHLVIQGENGTGKRMLAQLIHQLSIRRNKSFYEINCSNLPELMLDAELFGYEEGAFAEAIRGGKTGRLELARGGTVMLNEVGSVPINIQAKLIRVLQSREFERLGGNKPIRLDVRIIATSSVDLKRLVVTGKFRADLYYRLNVLNILIPPLRDRTEDVPLLAGHFLDRIIYEKDLLPKIFADETVATMKAYIWPGNVRELAATVERAAYISQEQVIKQEHLPQGIQQTKVPLIEGIRPLRGAIADLEKNYIQRALEITNNNRVAAAQLLGIPRATLYLKLKEYKLE
jgi:DNA-binding NtrC family response regulator/iron only hydrogenase large subunit-like protein